MGAVDSGAILARSAPKTKPENAVGLLARRMWPFPTMKVAPESRANRTLLSSVWAAAAVPASVLTAAAARKLKYSWILAFSEDLFLSFLV